MEKNLSIFLALIVCLISTNLSAKCYSFRKTNEVKVCMNGDSNADRRKAQVICQQMIGFDCGGIGGYTASCNKENNLKCYTEEGKERKNIIVD